MTIIEEMAEKALIGYKKKDETFTAFDVIRIGCLNLDEKEVRVVILFFMLAPVVIVGKDFIDTLLQGLKLPKKLIGLVKLILKFFIKESIFEILFMIGLRLDLKDLEVFKRIILRLQKIYAIKL